jgi:hypothetical protein
MNPAGQTPISRLAPLPSPRPLPDVLLWLSFRAERPALLLLREAPGHATRNLSSISIASDERACACGLAFPGNANLPIGAFAVASAFWGGAFANPALRPPPAPFSS